MSPSQVLRRDFNSNLFTLKEMTLFLAFCSVFQAVNPMLSGTGIAMVLIIGLYQTLRYLSQHLDWKKIKLVSNSEVS